MSDNSKKVVSMGIPDIDADVHKAFKVKCICTEVAVEFFRQIDNYLAGSNVDLAIRKPEIAKLVFTVVSDAGNDKLSNVKDISANQGVIMPPIMYAGEENS